MHQAIYDELRKVAREQRTTTYGDIAPLAQLDMENPYHRTEIARLLGEISTHEHELGRPLLSAVVIGKDTNIPGQGFFTLARELGRYSGDDDVAFFARELSRVFGAWK